MRVGLDATPLLGPRTGVGRYVDGLLSGLRELPDPPEVVLTAFTWRGTAPLLALAGSGVRVAPRRAPARVLQAAWGRFGVPPVEVLSGPVAVFHGTNFVLPPTRRAAGVVTVHDLAYLHHADTVSAASRRYRALVPRGLRRAAAVCAVSATVAAELVEHYQVDAERVVVTPNGLSPAWLAGPPPFTTAELRSRGLPERYVLFVGNLEPRKNLPVLLDAYRSLRGRRHDAPPLLLVGPRGWGPELDLSGLAPGSVVVAGYLDEPALTRVVAAAGCLVLPSREEGFGLPPLEALACGVPVVVSDLPVFREVLGEQADYVPVGDADALAAALERAADAVPTEAVRAARRAHAQRFTWRRCAEATMGAYRLAVGAG